MFICKGNCKTKFCLSIGDTLLRYNNGQKRCNICDVYFKWNGAKCPCCNAILHVRPRHSKAKKKYYKNEGIKWI